MRYNDYHWYYEQAKFTPTIDETGLTPGSKYLLEVFFFEDAFAVLTGVYPCFFDLIIDTVILQMPERAESLDKHHVPLYYCTDCNYISTNLMEFIKPENTGDIIAIVCLDCYFTKWV